MLQLRGLHRTTSSLVPLVRAVAAVLELCTVQSLQTSSRQLHTSPPSMKIYTKTGDKGTSSLYSGDRANKDSDTFHALGDVDEVNSTLGVAREYVKQLDARLAEQLEELQSRLFDVGSAIATPIPTSSEAKLQRVAFDSSHTARLEGWIDEMDKELPPLTQFILPSGGLAASFLHMARSTCRRAERSVVPLVRDGVTDESVGIFLNRLSDYLFVAARYAALKAGEQETVWKKAERPSVATS